MRILLKIVFVFFFINSFSQNLVPNSSFENYSSCPYMGGELYLAIGWISPVGAGNADYYNVCSSSIGVPGNGVDHFQYARSGVAYAGFYAFSTDAPDGREYVQKQLNSQLISDKCYLVEFYLNNVNWAMYV